MLERQGPAPSIIISLTSSEKEELQEIVRKHSCAHRTVIRASLILQLDSDPCVANAAKYLGVNESTVRKWREKYVSCGRNKSLEDAPRSGRPIEIDAASRCEIIAMACAKPSDYGVKFRNTWTCDAPTGTCPNITTQQFCRPDPGNPKTRRWWKMQC